MPVFLAEKSSQEIQGEQEGERGEEASTVGVPQTSETDVLPARWPRPPSPPGDYLVQTLLSDMFKSIHLGTEKGSVMELTGPVTKSSLRRAI